MSPSPPDLTRMTAPRVAIIGATGAVGAELLLCLEQRRFPLSDLRLFASSRSAGRRLRFRDEAIPVEELTDAALDGIDIALFSAGGATSRRFAPVAAEQGAVVVDNSSAFRMRPDVPLVVPEVNAAAIAAHRGIIANPNCVAIIAAVALWPLHQHCRIRRVIAATYQAASGAGAAAMAELRDSTAAWLEGTDFPPRVLGAAPGVRLVDDMAHNHFPMPREASGQDDVLVGRIREDVSDPSGCSVALFVAGDQLRKGAALNAVQIAEGLVG
jgi:aspartate-semialdehyde dehydrogenase